LHRAELLDALHRAAGPDVVRLGARCVGLVQDAMAVTARFEDGREARGDLLIGADGLRSAVRSVLFGTDPPRYGGYSAWRAVTRFDPARLTPGETWGRGRRFGQWGMTGGRAYWYATESVPAGQGDPPEGRKQGLLALFCGWHEPVEDLIEATDESAILRNDVYDRPALHRWSVGRATLLGDAAHPMTPDMGQGACQAIEDAVILADCLRPVGPRLPRRFAPTSRVASRAPGGWPASRVRRVGSPSGRTPLRAGSARPCSTPRTPPGSRPSNWHG
jgi:2-polyprenyl-6-methoxyphenol hydroxylase-like FAD-dependent oxidoreductase